MRRAYKLQLFRAVALARMRDDRGAAEQLAPLLHTAQAEGLCRVLVDEGEALTGLLQRHAASAAGSAWLASESARDWWQRYLAQARLNPATSSTPTVQTTCAEALTPKELRVLRLLAEGHSNSAIASQLFVSESTVRTHLRHLNVKLSADSRTQAVARARSAGLL